MSCHAGHWCKILAIWHPASIAFSSSHLKYNLIVLQDLSITSGDVYINEPKLLQEGEEKHVLSVFVADEPGLINRVAGVFGRRGTFFLA